jgi:hypothetical protein
MPIIVPTSDGLQCNQQTQFVGLHSPDHVPVIAGVPRLFDHALGPVPILTKLLLHPRTEIRILLAHAFLDEFCGEKRRHYKGIFDP